MTWMAQAIAKPGQAAARSEAAQQQPSQSQQQQPSQPQQQQPPASQQQGNAQQPQEQQKVFTGTMGGKAGEYNLHDDASKSTYGLDHQAELSKYNLTGKKVQVVGSLDSAGQTIHIVRIALVQSNTGQPNAPPTAH
jgi:hypothetical protein